MPADEALGLAQILLGLLLFTVGIPALIIEVRVEEPLRRLLHKRIHQQQIFTLGAITLLVVAVLIIFSGTEVDLVLKILLKSAVIFLIGGFTKFWIDIYKNVNIDLVIKDIVQDLQRQLRENKKFESPDLEDLVTFGENIKGGEKQEVIYAIGDLCGKFQELPVYDGTQLEELLRGLQRVVIHDGTLEHHRSALDQIIKIWETLNRHGLDAERDSRVLREVVSTLVSLAVTQKLEGAIVLRWMGTFPNAVDVQYRIGIAALKAGDFTVAIEALSRLSVIGDARETPLKELIALVAYFHAAGPAADHAARGLLKLPPDQVRRAAETAIDEFRDDNDYVSADAISAFLRPLSVTREPQTFWRLRRQLTVRSKVQDSK